MGVKEQDPVVFPEGVHEHDVDGVKVTLVVPHDVRLSQLAAPLAKLAEAEREGGDADAA